MKIVPKPVIVIDPGHGSTKGMKGFDSGATFGVRTEAEANIEAALTLKFLMQQLGWAVYLTHNGFQGAKPDLNGRLLFAARMKADLFVSLHYDMTFTPPKHLRGVYYAPGVSSFALAKEIQKAQGLGAWLKPSNGSRFGGLYIDAFPDSKPSVLVELDSIEFAPGKNDGQGRTKMLQPIAFVLDRFVKR